MKILFVAAEVHPFQKQVVWGDVIGALPKITGKKQDMKLQ